MTYRLCFSYWLLVCWVLVTVAEGQREGATPPGGSQDNGGATDCQVFTLTPPPPRRNPVTRIWLITKPLKYPFHSFPQQGPRVHIRFPNRPFLPQKYNHLFQFRPGFWPHDCFTPHYKYFPKRRLWRGSSSEESREKREVPNMLKPKKPMPERRLLLSSSKLKCLNLKMKYLKLD